VSDHVVYVDRFKVAEGKLEDLKSYASEMSEAVANKVPGVLSFNYFIDEGGENGTAVFVFENADALDTHLQVNAERFQEAMPLVAETSIELMGPASETAKQVTAQFGGSLKTKLAGFGR
jgi:quinol monooxygenase YgiN